jgi:hypothetical protein
MRPVKSPFIGAQWVIQNARSPTEAALNAPVNRMRPEALLTAIDSPIEPEQALL